MNARHFSIALAVVILSFATVCSQANSFQVSLDTSSLSGTTQALVFEFTDGDGIFDNAVAVSGFSFGGGSIAGPPNYLGTTGVSGDLSSSVSMDDGGGFALFLQNFTLGSSLSFDLATTDNSAGGPPDAFSMGLYAPDLSACYSDDQSSCSLLQIELNGGPPIISAIGASAQGVPAPVVTTEAVPEPSSAWLLGAGTMLIAYGLRQRARSLHVA
jgi:hypothetical protein